MAAATIPLPPPDDDEDDQKRRSIAPIGSTEDLENKAAARTIPQTSTQTPEIGSTEDLEAKADANPHIQPTAPHPVTSGVASLWAKADHIHNPILRVIGKIGAAGARAADTIGSIAAPGVAAMIPGTTMNATVNQNRQRAQNTEDIENEEKQAQTKNLDAQPELKQAKLAQDQAKIDETAEKNKNQNAAVLRKQGLKTGEDGSVQPIQYADMSPHEQGVFDLQNAEKEMKEAQTALAQSKNDPTSPIYQQAQTRLQTAQKNAQTAAGRLGLEGLKYKGDYLGEDAEGKALPGTSTDASGAPIGPKIQHGNAAGKPTAQQVNKSDLANNVKKNVAKMNKIIDENPNLLGKVAGHFTSFEQMIGSDDLAIARMGVIGHNTALASNGIHGVKGEKAVADTEAVLLNHFRNGSEATKAAFNEMADSVGDFVKPTPGAAPGSEFKVPSGAPKAPEEDGKRLKMNGKVIAISKGGSWVAAQ